MYRLGAPGEPNAVGARDLSCVLADHDDLNVVFVSDEVKGVVKYRHIFCPACSAEAVAVERCHDKRRRAGGAR
jgi:hypothetical protein